LARIEWIKKPNRPGGHACGKTWTISAHSEIIDGTTQKTSELCPVSGDVSRKMEPVAQPSYIAATDASILEVWASATLYTAEALWPERLAAWELGACPGHKLKRRPCSRGHGRPYFRSSISRRLSSTVNTVSPLLACFRAEINSLIDHVHWLVAKGQISPKWLQPLESVLLLACSVALAPRCASDSGRSARSLRGAREHKNCLRAELGEQAIVVQRLAAHQRHTEEIKLRTAELSVKALVDALFSQCQRQMIRWQLLPIYHVRKAREFRRSFLLATTVFKNKSLILDSEGPGDECGARH
jgi:hypothetical protein